ncbi:MAG: glycosyltransferase family 9 protein [Rhodanobacter sp.]
MRAVPNDMSSALSPVVIRFGRLGDTLLLQPLLHKLQQRYGRPCRLLAVGAWPEDLYDSQPEVSEVITLHAPHRPLLISPERWRVIRQLRNMREAPIYVCEPQPRALAKICRMLALAGIPADRCVYLTDMPWPGDGHWVDRLLCFGDRTPAAFCGMYGPLMVDLGAAPQLLVSTAERADCDSWLRKRDLAGKQLVLLQPANKRTMRWSGVRHASDDDKCWPVERWAALARNIVTQRPDARVVLCGCPAEAGYLEEIRAASAHPAVTSAAGELPLGRLKALMAVAHSMVSVDTGPAHLAAAVDCPLAVLFGSVPPSQWAPRSANSKVTILGGPPHSTRVDAITLEQVMDAWHGLSVRPVAWRAAAAVTAAAAY